MSDSTTETSVTENSSITLEDVSLAMHDGYLRVDFMTRVRVHFENDADVLAWFSRENSVYHDRTPWEVFYGNAELQGTYIDNTCNVFCRGLYKRLPADLPALPPAPSED